MSDHDVRAALHEPVIDRLIDGADHADPAAAQAARIPALSRRQEAPTVAADVIAAWLREWENGTRRAIKTTAAQLYDTNLAARAVLRLAGHLHGPDVRVRVGLAVAVGDQLVLTSHHRPRTLDEISPGVLLHVTAVNPAGVATVDIPTTGEQRQLAAGSPFARRVTYSYATSPTTERALHRSDAALRPTRGLTW